jgi:hypothetical protein
MRRGRSCFLAFLQRRPYATITAWVEGGLLTNLHAVVNLDATS